MSNDVSFMKYTNKNIYFKDIHFFVTRIKKIAAIKDDKLMRDNLWICFRNTTLK